MATEIRNPGWRAIMDKLQARESAAALDEKNEPCPTCDRIGDGFGPTHNGSPHCESGSIASGGTTAHCTCDTCF